MISAKQITKGEIATSILRMDQPVRCWPRRLFQSALPMPPQVAALAAGAVLGGIAYFAGPAYFAPRVVVSMPVVFGVHVPSRLLARSVGSLSRYAVPRQIAERRMEMSRRSSIQLIVMALASAITSGQQQTRTLSPPRRSVRLSGRKCLIGICRLQAVPRFTRQAPRPTSGPGSGPSPPQHGPDVRPPPDAVRPDRPPPSHSEHRPRPPRKHGYAWRDGHWRWYKGHLCLDLGTVGA